MLNLILWNRPLDVISLVDLLLYWVSLIHIVPLIVSVIRVPPIILILIIIFFPTRFPSMHTAFSVLETLIIPVLMLWLVETNNFPMSEIQISRLVLWAWVELWKWLWWWLILVLVIWLVLVLRDWWI